MAWMNPNQLLSRADRRAGRKITSSHKVDVWLDRTWQKKYAWTAKRITEAAGAGGMIGLVIFFMLSNKLGSSARDRKHKRGSQLVIKSKLIRLARTASRGKPRFSIAGVPIPQGAEYQHALFQGTTGAGKTKAVIDRLAQIRRHGDRAIVYDPEGELIQYFWEEGDGVLNPFDKRALPWDMRSEIRIQPDAEAVGKSLIQPNGQDHGQNQFFYDSAGDVLGAILKRPDLGDATTLIRNTTTGDLAKMLGASASVQLEGKSGAEIHKTIMSRMLGFQYAAKRLAGAGGQGFSVRDWVDNGKGWLWLTSVDNLHAALEPMLSLWLELAAIQLLSRRDNKNVEPLHFVVDEFASLQRLPAMLRLLSRGRKRKVAVLFATQSPGQLVQIYKREGLQAINDTVGSRLSMRLEDPDSCEFASRMLGEQEVIEQKLSRNMGQRLQGTNLNEQITKERIVLPGDISSLPDLYAYLKLAGGLPAARVQVPYVNPKKITPGFVEQGGWEIENISHEIEASYESFDKVFDTGGSMSVMEDI